MFRSSVIAFSAIAAVSASFLLGTAQVASADPHSPAARVAAAQPTNTVAAAIAKVPQARWFTPDNSVSTIRTAVAQYVQGAAATNTVPVLVTYAIPGRDCGRPASSTPAAAASTSPTSSPPRRNCPTPRPTPRTTTPTCGSRTPASPTASMYQLRAFQ
jgi:hypothetical protein